MAIKIRKKAEDTTKPVLTPEVLPPEGSAQVNSSVDEATLGQTAPQAPTMDDKFVMRSGSFMAWLLEHRTMVLAITVVLLIIALSWIGVQKYKDSQEITRSTEVLSNAFVTYTALTKPQADFIEAQNLDTLKKKGMAAESDDIRRFSYTVPSDHARFAAIEKHLTAIIPEHADTPIETSATLMLAGSKARIKAPADSIAAYQKAESSKNADIKLFAQLGETEMLIGALKYDEAIHKLDQIASENPAFTSYTRLEKGRIFEIKGETEKAIAAYDEIIKAPGDAVAKQKALIRLRPLTPDWENRIKHLQAAPAQQAEL